MENKINVDNIKKELNEQLIRKEWMWRQKFREEWIRDGDANPKFFHIF